MSLTDLLLNKYAAGVFILGTSLLAYRQLRRPWGVILPAAALLGVLIVVNAIANEAMRYVVIYGGYGFLFSFAEWFQKKLSPERQEEFSKLINSVKMTGWMLCC